MLLVDGSIFNSQSNFTLINMVRSTSDNYGSSSSVAPFLRKCYEMVNDESTNSVISWAKNNDSFVIWEMTEFTVQLLPKYFKHSNFSSFIRQLNIYGFRKIDTDRWEFANEGFIRGQRNLLKNIARRKNTQSSEQKSSVQQQDNNSVEMLEKDEKREYYTELWKDIENLKIDKEEVVQELGKLRQHQETVDGKMLRLRERVGGMEKNQQQMLSFLVMAMQTPGILAQFLHPKENNNSNNWHVIESDSMLEQSTEDNKEATNGGMIVKYQPSNEPATPVTCSEKPQEEFTDQSSDGMKDFVMDIDFMKLLMDENLSPFVPPGLPDNVSAWENLLLASPFNVYEDGQDSSEMETETQLEKSRSFKLMLDQMEKNPEDFGIQPTTHGSHSLYSDYPTERF